MSDPSPNPATESPVTEELDATTRARLVLGAEGFDRVVALLEHPPAPTSALIELMRGDGR